ncbi:MAG: GMC family oxidoreductase N-terminal domain-containing protein [Myxococcota bacterium]|nr:GMC family oxidoreductase N-terminal domain-containing protein [Myxococcota bacterium]
MKYDTIVVGAGSTGSVISERLSRISGHQVLLIEAGPDHLPEQLPPDLANGRQNATSHDWGFKHRPTVRQFRFPLPRGRVVGGSSAVNTCIAIRALPRDIDEWSARGLAEWTFEKTLPAFCAIETDSDFDTPHHGQDGPLPLRRHPPDERGTWQAALIEAAAELGFAPCADTNNPDTPEGFGPHAMNKRDGRRISAAEAWLTPAVRSRDSFHLRADTTVLHLDFSADTVTGVTVQTPSGPQRILAGRVILCAGSIQTPRLLMASGIGPRAELDRLNVPLRIDRPGVGAQLLDHPGFAFFLRPKHAGLSDSRCGLIQTVLRTSLASGPAHDVQVQVGSIVPVGKLNLPLVSIMAMLGKPAAAGTIRWPSLDSKATPRIESRFLSHPDDLDRACAAVELGLALLDTPAMRDLATTFFPMSWTLRSRNRLKKRILGVCDSGYHPCGTAPMGADDDPMAVTDGRGRVRGTRNLFIGDASLMPTIPTGNIHLTTLMIGQRIGEWLAQDTD